MTQLKQTLHFPVLHSMLATTPCPRSIELTMAYRGHTHSPTKEEHNAAVDAAAKAAHQVPVEPSRSFDPEGRH